MRASHPMHVHLYKVKPYKNLQPLEGILAQLGRMSLENRVRQLGYQEFRLDEAVHPDRHWPMWRIAVCKFRGEGPGLAKRDTPSKSMNLADDDEFTEDTAMLFDPAAKAIVMQYNHYGPRAGSVADYFSAWLGANDAAYELAPQLNQNVQARLKSKKQFTRVAFRVAPAMITDAWKNNNVALATMLENQVKAWDGEWVTVAISLDARDPQNTLSVKDKLKALIGLSHESRDAVKILQVSGRDDVGLRVDQIDLLAERLERTYNGLPLDQGRRVSMDDRWKALHDSYEHWKRDGLIR